MRKKADKSNFGGNGQQALERDGHKCVQCKMANSEHLEKYGCSLSVDHIDGQGRYSKTKNHSLDNLQTLCLHCHGKKDSQPQKISDRQVREIIECHSLGMRQKNIADKFKVSPMFVSFVVRGKRRAVK